MIGEVTLDLETQNTFRETGRRDTKGLKISVVGVYTSGNDTFRAYTEDEFPELWPVLERAERIIGFNHRWFDMPVLNNYYPGDCTKLPLLDIMEEAQRTLGRRCKLDDIAAGTLGVGKSGHGLDAVRYWKEGNMDALIAYCLDDVKITRDVYHFGKANGYVMLKERIGEPKKIAVDFNKQTKNATVNLTLGL